MTIFELTKTVATVATGIGAKKIASEAITKIAPPAVTGTQKFFQSMGAAGIGLAVSGAAAKSMGAYCDKLKAVAESVLQMFTVEPSDEDNTEDVEDVEDETKEEVEDNERA